MTKATITTTIKKILFLLLTVFLLFSCKNQTPNYTPVEKDTKTYKELTLEGEVYDYNAYLKLYLISGLDSNNIEEGQTDFIGLFIFDREKKEYKILNLPREMVVTTNLYASDGSFLTENNNYLNLIYSLNGGGNKGANKLVEEVQEIINNIPIYSYIVLPLQSINTLGKIFEGTEYTIPNDSLIYLNPKWTKGETILIDESNIVNILRSRDTTKENSAILRRERQNEFFKTIKIVDFDKDEIMKILENSISNMSLREYENLYNMLLAYSFEDVYELSGNYSSGLMYDEFELNEQESYILIKSLFYE